jgi:hypothetical protein
MRDKVSYPGETTVSCSLVRFFIKTWEDKTFGNNCSSVLSIHHDIFVTLILYYLNSATFLMDLSGSFTKFWTLCIFKFNSVSKTFMEMCTKKVLTFSSKYHGT